MEIQVLGARQKQYNICLKLNFKASKAISGKNYLWRTVYCIANNFSFPSIDVFSYSQEWTHSGYCTVRPITGLAEWDSFYSTVLSADSHVCMHANENFTGCHFAIKIRQIINETKTWFKKANYYNLLQTFKNLVKQTR